MHLKISSANMAAILSRGRWVLPITQHSFRQCLGAECVTSHHLNWYWSRYLTYRQVSNTNRTIVGTRIVAPLRCSRSIARGLCSNHIFIPHWTLGFNILSKDECKPRRKTFKFSDLVQLILDILRYTWAHHSMGLGQQAQGLSPTHAKKYNRLNLYLQIRPNGPSEKNLYPAI